MAKDGAMRFNLFTRPSEEATSDKDRSILSRLVVADLKQAPNIC